MKREEVIYTSEITKKDARTGLEIAVIGLAGRFPGAANIAQFWENLKNGVESISFFPDGELEESVPAPGLLENPAYVKANGYLEGKEYFDGFFFGYSPKEAEIMDPQVRIFHECAWEALEDAGCSSDSYKKQVGLYVGASSSSYWEALTLLSGKNSALGQFEASKLADKDFLSTRVAYKLDLKGPCFSMQTACSTSLVAVDLACRGLLTGQCALALAGGVKISAIKTGYLYEEGMVMSPDGHCRAFDAQAKGIVGGEGAGIAVLKPLEDAIDDGDHIYAVIKGSAVNNDGSRKVGFSAPSIKGQIEVIRTAQHMADVEPRGISYVETHGTATTTGDPIEMKALIQAFNTDKKGFCAIGSVKTNVGHLDTAAGIASFIKTVLALKHRLIPPSLHFEAPNPGIDFENSPFYVNRRLSQWKNEQYPLRAGVSSFGIGGTNAHVVLEEWPGGQTPGPPGQAREYQLLLLSAKTKTALDKMTENLVEYFKGYRNVPLADAAYTLQVGRKAFKHRGALVCTDVNDAIGALSTPNSRKVHNFFVTKEDRPVVFMFSGQGSQYIDMGLELYRKEPVFAGEIDRCAGILQRITGYDIRKILYPAADSEEAKKRIFRQEIIQPMFFIFEYALARLLMKWGIEPYAMIGYSIGEYVAACLAGVFTLEEGIKLVAARGRMMQEIPPGVMLSVPLCRKDLEPLLNHQLSVAVDNGESCIVSGPEQDIVPFEKKLKEKKYWCMRLDISHAGHSKMMDGMLKEFEEEVGKVSLKRPRLPYMSNVTGRWITVEEACDPRYWARQVRETVRFVDGIKELLEEPHLLFVEIGPGRSLSTLVIREMEIENKPGHRVVNLVRHPGKDTSDVYYLLNRLGQLWLYGTGIDWNAFHAREKRHRIPLPPYPFEGRRYWIKGNPFARGDWMDLEGAPSFEKPGVEDLTSTDEYEYGRGNEPGELRPYVSSPYAAPRTHTERVITDIWKEMFGFDQIGIRDDFFELGGDSLKAMTVGNSIHKELNVIIPLKDFFGLPTIEGLTGYIAANGKKTAYYSIEPVEKKEYYPASSSQKRLFVVQQLEPGSMKYNMPMFLVLDGKTDGQRLEKTFKKLIKRHENLRSSFGVVEGEPVQRIHDNTGFGPGCYELANEPSPETRQQEIIRNFVRPFDLSRAPLLRVKLVKVENEKFMLLIDMHHIISDGVSQTVLERDFLQLHAQKGLPGLKLHYKDYSEWQRQTKTKSDNGNRQEQFWLNLFKGDIPKLDLPTDFERPDTPTFAGSVLTLVIDEEDTRALKALAFEANATLFMLLLAIYIILLAKVSGQEEIIVGTPITGRRHADLEQIIGMFVNMLVLRTFPQKELTFKEFLAEVRETTLGAFENQDYQFDDLVANVVKVRDTTRNQLFDVVFQFDNFEEALIESFIEGIPGMPGLQSLKGGGISPFDLTFIGQEEKGRLIFKFEYSTALFKEATIEQLSGHYTDISKQLVENEDIKLKDISIFHGLLVADTYREDLSDFVF